MLRRFLPQARPRVYELPLADGHERSRSARTSAPAGAGSRAIDLAALRARR